MKVIVDFPAIFDSDEPLPLQLGRLVLGSHIVRLVFTPDGQMKMAISQKAIDDGSVIVHSGTTETPIYYGFAVRKDG